MITDLKEKAEKHKSYFNSVLQKMQKGRNCKQQSRHQSQGKICKYLENNVVMIGSQYGFIKNKSCQINPISFVGWLISLVDGGNFVDIISLQ